MCLVKKKFQKFCGTTQNNRIRFSWFYLLKVGLGFTEVFPILLFLAGGGSDMIFCEELYMGLWKYDLDDKLKKYSNTEIDIYCTKHKLCKLFVSTILQIIEKHVCSLVKIIVASDQSLFHSLSRKPHVCQGLG